MGLADRAMSETHPLAFAPPADAHANSTTIVIPMNPRPPFQVRIAYPVQGHLLEPPNVSRFCCAANVVTASEAREPDAYRASSNRLLESRRSHYLAIERSTHSALK